MVVGVITVLAVLFAVLVCLLSGGFAGLSWLWALPVTFVCAFLGQLLLIFIVLVVSCALVDLKKPQEKDSPFFRFIAYVVIEGVMTLGRITLRTTGMEKMPQDGRFILVCNHRDDSDPALLLYCFRKYQLAFISKWENYAKFVIGPVMHKILCQPINRENDREALKTILKCIQLIKEDTVSVAVFPEGYIHDDRKLHPFRPGVFKIAQRTRVPIVVCTMKNTTNVFPNLFRLKPTTVELNLLDVIGPEEYEGKSTVQISDRIYQMMADDLGEDLVFHPEDAENT